jgi:hypothetical protein
VAEETLKSLPPEEIAAHILWEMTFYGFSDEEIGKEKEKVERALRDMESGEVEIIPLEELLKEIDRKKLKAEGADLSWKP